MSLALPVFHRYLLLFWAWLLLKRKDHMREWVPMESVVSVVWGSNHQIWPFHLNPAHGFIFSWVIDWTSGATDWPPDFTPGLQVKGAEWKPAVLGPQEPWCDVLMYVVYHNAHGMDSFYDLWQVCEWLFHIVRSFYGRGVGPHFCLPQFCWPLVCFGI